jgi:hypothetical protein
MRWRGSCFEPAGTSSSRLPLATPTARPSTGAPHGWRRAAASASKRQHGYWHLLIRVHFLRHDEMCSLGVRSKRAHAPWELMWGASSDILRILPLPQCACGRPRNAGRRYRDGTAERAGGGQGPGCGAAELRGAKGVRLACEIYGGYVDHRRINISKLLCLTGPFQQEYVSAN